MEQYLPSKLTPSISESSGQTASSRGPTIAELRQRVEADPKLDPVQKRDRHSALNSYAKHLGLDPERDPVTFYANRLRLQKFAPAAHGIQDKTWQNVLSNVTTVFREHGIRVRVRPCLRDLRPTWRALRDLVQERLQQRLSAMIHFFNVHGIDPEQVDDEAAARFHRYLIEETHEKRPNAVLQSCCRAWNEASGTVTGWPATRLTVPEFRKRVRLAEELFPVSLRDEIAQWRALMSGASLLDDRAPDKPLKPSTLFTKTEQVWRYVSALVHSGAMRPVDVTSLELALVPRHFEAALTWYLRRDGKSTPGLAEMAATMLGIARHSVQLEPESIKLLARACKRVNCRRVGMTSKNMERLRPLLDPAIQLKLLTLPDRLLDQARRTKNRRKAALLVQTALAIAILLVAPIRLGNLLHLEMDKHLVYAMPNRRGQLRLVLEGFEVKNGQDQQFIIKGRTREILELFIKRYLVELFNRATTKIFPGDVGGFKHEVTLRWQIMKAIRGHVGVEMNPHLFRHFAAANILRKNPEAFPMVSFILGHKSMQTAKDFYIAFVGTIINEYFQDHVLEPARGKNTRPRKDRE